MDDQSTPSRKQSADQKRRDRRNQEKEDMAFILDSQQGRRFFWRLLTMAGVYRSSFTGDSRTFFREGERNIGLQVLRDIHEIDPNIMARMVEENRDDRTDKRSDRD